MVGSAQLDRWAISPSWDIAFFIFERGGKKFNLFYLAPVCDSLGLCVLTSFFCIRN